MTTSAFIEKALVIACGIGVATVLHAVGRGAAHELLGDDSPARVLIVEECDPGETP